MKSLQTSTILSLLTREVQMELHRELTNSLFKNINKSPNIYTVLMNESYPTGGDWCDHDTLILATGNYREAKNKYDVLHKEIEEYGDFMEVRKSIVLMKGDDILESIYYDNNNDDPKIRKENNYNKNSNLENYDIKFPIYYIMKDGPGYDSLYLIDVYENFLDARQAFYALQIVVEEPEGRDINIMLFSLSDDNRRKLVLDFKYFWDLEFPDDEIME